MGLDPKRHSAEVQAIEMAEGSVESSRRQVRSGFLPSNFHQASAAGSPVQLYRGFFHEMARAVFAVHRALRLSRAECDVAVFRGGVRAARLLSRRCLEPLGAPPQ